MVFVCVSDWCECTLITFICFDWQRWIFYEHMENVENSLYGESTWYCYQLNERLSCGCRINFNASFLVGFSYYKNIKLHSAQSNFHSRAILALLLYRWCDEHSVQEMNWIQFQVFFFPEDLSVRRESIVVFENLIRIFLQKNSIESQMNENWNFRMTLSRNVWTSNVTHFLLWIESKKVDKLLSSRNIKWKG